MDAEVQALESGAETAHNLYKLISQVMSCATIKAYCYTDNKCIAMALDSTKRKDKMQLSLDFLVLKDMICRRDISRVS